MTDTPAKPAYARCRDCWSDGFRLTDGLCDGCHEETLSPRWWQRRYLLDARLIDMARPFLRDHPRVHRQVARYALRFIHCPRDGQCYLRAGHRGGCDWGE